MAVNSSNHSNFLCGYLLIVKIQKLAVGGIPEKILTAFKLVHDEDVNEEAALNQFRSAVPHVQEIEKDVENISSQGVT